MRTTVDVVLDASAAVELLLASALGGDVDRALGRDPAIHVPELFAVEVLAAIRGAERRKELVAARAAAAVDDLLGLPLIRWAHSDELLRRAWELRAAVSTYDAMYLALAERLGAVLLTTDRRLAAAARARTGVPTAPVA